MNLRERYLPIFKERSLKRTYKLIDVYRSEIENEKNMTPEKLVSWDETLNDLHKNIDTIEHNIDSYGSVEQWMKYDCPREIRDILYKKMLEDGINEDFASVFKCGSNIKDHQLTGAMIRSIIEGLEKSPIKFQVQIFFYDHVFYNNIRSRGTRKKWLKIYFLVSDKNQIITKKREYVPTW